MSDTSRARHVVAAAFLGWMLDAFDFFIMVFLFSEIAGEFHTTVTSVTVAVTLTLAMRAAGAFIFGRLADHYGRRPILMASVLSYSLLELASGFAPTLMSFFVLRALFGLAMGGEWGIGASLTMESIPPRWRGTVSGLLQAGYPSGYLLATLVNWLVSEQFVAQFTTLSRWRIMFMIGALPALLVLYIRQNVPESPEWSSRKASAAAPAAPGLAMQDAPTSNGFFATLGRSLPLTIYAVLMMMAFNFYSHGSQDMYPHFLRDQLKFDKPTFTGIAVIYNLGAIVGGLAFGTLSQRIGRRAAIALAALCSLPVIPLWAFSSSPVMLAVGSFLMQVCVQGAWGIVPAHLNELSPVAIRATFPGLVYQLGNFLASANATMQSGISDALGHDLRYPLAGTIGVVAVLLVVLMIFGPESRSEVLGQDRTESRAIPFLPLTGTLCLIGGLIAVIVAFLMPTVILTEPGTGMAQISPRNLVGAAGMTGCLAGVILVSAGAIVNALRRPAA